MTTTDTDKVADILEGIVTGVDKTTLIEKIEELRTANTPGTRKLGYRSPFDATAEPDAEGVVS